MASHQNSPVLVQHASPPHTLSPEASIVSFSDFPTEALSQEHGRGLASATEDPTTMPPTLEPQSNRPPPTQDEADTPMADAPTAVIEEQPPDPTAPADMETMRTQSPVSDAPPMPVEGGPADPAVPNTGSQEQPITAEGELNTPPPQPSADVPKPSIPDWVTWEDDLTVPDEEELKEIEGSEADMSALDVAGIEKKIYQEVEDPEQRPVKKIRLSWVIKGVRGTRERPNHARAINSPCAFINGSYWQIKFYPRGNKTSSISAYIRCTKRMPKPDEEVPESTFCYFEGLPDANMGEGAEPTHVLNVPASLAKPEATPGSDSIQDEVNPSKDNEAGASVEQPNPTASQDDDVEMRNDTKADCVVEDDFRISAQLGMVIYNPAEPRTNTHMSSEHQFSENNDDWGWNNFVGPWNQIHIRQRGQRQALLRNDTIAIDAYIRIFDDPSQALWWHESTEHESQWPSKKLAGYFAMGTPPLFYSPAVAGMTAWLLLAPFRKLLENVNAGKWRMDSQIKPRPILSQLQIVLHLLRNLKGSDYVDVYYVIDAMRSFGETYCDVMSFWEAFRRSIELELDGEDQALRQISNIFDTQDGKFGFPPLPVEGTKDIQGGIDACLASMTPRCRSTPNFLPLLLRRETFDESTREWKIRHDRVILNDEIDVPQSDADGDVSKYTLYGFMVHDGERSSGRFYSILRPNGPGSKWLAFADGDGNKVFSYTKKRIQDFEGLEGEDLKNFKSTRQTAYMAMYVRNSHLQDYLPGKMEPYELPEWLKPCTFSTIESEDESIEKRAEIDHDINLEIYHDEAMIGREGLLDMFNVKQQSLAGRHFRTLNLPPKTTFQEVRQKLAHEMQVDKVERIKLFIMSYGGVGQYTSARWLRVLLNESLSVHAATVGPLCLWTSLLETEEDLKLFGDSEPVEKSVSETAVNGEGSGDEPRIGVESEAVTSTTAEASVTTQPQGQAIDTANNVAGPDAVQASVQEAVSADLERADAAMENTETAPQVINIMQHSTAISTEQTPTLEEPRPAPVEHGHLVDAVMSEAPATAPGLDVAAASVIENTITEVREAQMFPDQPDVFTETDAVIASLIAGDAETMDFIPQPPTHDDHRASTPAPETALLNLQARPVSNVYGFLQVFDTEKQNFTVHSTFFAKRDAVVKDSVRRFLGYDAEQEFHAWHRETDLDGSAVDSKATFEDIQFSNGVDMIVGKVLPESKIEELRQQGKFSCPFMLTRFLRMLQRKHPIKAMTTSKAIEIADFGTEYYKGPLVNGLFHGEACLRITPNGQCYEGPLISGDKSGKAGKMTYQNGDTYEGEWLNDECHGQGTFTEKRTGNKYVGGFENGKRWGKGTTYWEVADEQADMCQICYGEEIDALFFDCGHVCSCMECAKQCEACPICRKSVRQVVKMYWA